MRQPDFLRRRGQEVLFPALLLRRKYLLWRCALVCERLRCEPWRLQHVQRKAGVRQAELFPDGFPPCEKVRRGLYSPGRIVSLGAPENRARECFTKKHAQFTPNPVNRRIVVAGHHFGTTACDPARPCAMRSPPVPRHARGLRLRLRPSRLTATASDNAKDISTAVGLRAKTLITERVSDRQSLSSSRVNSELRCSI